jgi:retron-type reverse transcriptase
LGPASLFSRNNKRAKVTITQNGHKIKGTFGLDGMIEGTLENDTIIFDWYSASIEGRGKWKIGNDGLSMTGAYVSEHIDSNWALKY